MFYYNMITKMAKLPKKILGFEASGNVTAKDYEKVILPAVEKTRQDGNEIRFLYHLGKKFKKMDFGAMIDDSLMTIKYFRHWEKFAVVSDVNWIRNTSKALGIFWPGRVKAYMEKDLSKALSWIKK